MPARPRRVIGYARVSSSEQARGTSLTDQQNVIRAFAKARGMNVDRFYVEAESAVREKIEHRAQMRALMADVRAGDLVLCDKLDRWSRDAEFAYQSVRQILEKRARMYFVGDQCDPSTPDGDSMMSFRILFAREEHKRIKLRMVGTRKTLRDLGYYVEGLPPYGYRRAQPKGYKGLEKNVLVVEPTEAATVRRVFKLCVSGKSLQQIADAVDLRKDHVADVLHNRLYVGQIEDSSGTWIAGKHQAIVDADIFSRAASALVERRHGAARFRTGPVETSNWILRDVARCALCDGKMTSAWAGDRGKRRHYYKCRNACTRRYVPVRLVEAAAAELFEARLVELRSEIARGADGPRPGPENYDEQISAIERRRERVVHMYEDGALDREKMRARMVRLDGDRLRVEAARAAEARPSRLADASTRRALLADVRRLTAAWRVAQPRDRRQMVNLVASTVRLQAGHAPVFVWRSAEELAEDGEGSPVNAASARTYANRRGVDSPFRAAFLAVGVH